ncbi:MAG TPA: hypothetical protein VNM16_08875, partial [Bacillota bacterium]|nr:hypothetical protein [Bacillota bacterium]
DRLRERLLRCSSILIRGPEGFEGLSEACFRVAVRSPEDNARLLLGLQSSIEPATARARPARSL